MGKGRPRPKTNSAGRLYTFFLRGVSSAGRAPALQAGGHRFDPGTLHFKEAVKVAFNGSRRTIISFVPDESSAEEGLCYRLYRDVYAELAKRPPTDVESLMPVRRDHWIYKEGAGPDSEGFEGFL